MVVTAWVMLELEGDRPDVEGDPILMRGDNLAAISWVTRCGGARDKTACLLMRMLGRLELAGGWNNTAKHIAGVQNIVAEDISRPPRSMLADKVREQINSGVVWTKHWNAGVGDFRYSATKKIRSQHDDMLRNLIGNEAEHA